MKYKKYNIYWFLTILIIYIFVMGLFIYTVVNKSMLIESLKQKLLQKTNIEELVNSLFTINKLNANNTTVDQNKTVYLSKNVSFKEDFYLKYIYNKDASFNQASGDYNDDSNYLFVLVKRYIIESNKTFNLNEILASISNINDDTNMLKLVFNKVNLNANLNDEQSFFDEKFFLTNYNLLDLNSPKVKSSSNFIEPAYQINNSTLNSRRVRNLQSSSNNNKVSKSNNQESNGNKTSNSYANFKNSSINTTQINKTVESINNSTFLISNNSNNTISLDVTTSKNSASNSNSNNNYAYLFSKKFKFTILEKYSINFFNEEILEKLGIISFSSENNVELNLSEVIQQVLTDQETNADSSASLAKSTSASNPQNNYLQTIIYTSTNILVEISNTKFSYYNNLNSFTYYFLIETLSGFISFTFFFVMVFHFVNKKFFENSSLGDSSNPDNIICSQKRNTQLFSKYNLNFNEDFYEISNLYSGSLEYRNQCKNTDNYNKCNNYNNNFLINNNFPPPKYSEDLVGNTNKPNDEGVFINSSKAEIIKVNNSNPAEAFKNIKETKLKSNNNINKPEGLKNNTASQLSNTNYPNKYYSNNPLLIYRIISYFKLIFNEKEIDCHQNNIQEKKDSMSEINTQNNYFDSNSTIKTSFYHPNFQYLISKTKDLFDEEKPQHIIDNIYGIPEDNKLNDFDIKKISERSQDPRENDFSEIYGKSSLERKEGNCNFRNNCNNNNYNNNFYNNNPAFGNYLNNSLKDRDLEYRINEGSKNSIFFSENNNNINKILSKPKVDNCSNKNQSSITVKDIGNSNFVIDTENSIYTNPLQISSFSKSLKVFTKRGCEEENVGEREKEGLKPFDKVEFQPQENPNITSKNNNYLENKHKNSSSKFNLISNEDNFINNKIRSNNNNKMQEDFEKEKEINDNNYIKIETINSSNIKKSFKSTNLENINNFLNNDSLHNNNINYKMNNSLNNNSVLPDFYSVNETLNNCNISSGKPNFLGNLTSLTLSSRRNGVDGINLEKSDNTNNLEIIEDPINNTLKKPNINAEFIEKNLLNANVDIKNKKESSSCFSFNNKQKPNENPKVISNLIHITNNHKNGNDNENNHNDNSRNFRESNNPQKRSSNISNNSNIETVLNNFSNNNNSASNYFEVNSDMIEGASSSYHNNNNNNNSLNNLGNAKENTKIFSVKKQDNIIKSPPNNDYLANSKEEPFDNNSFNKERLNNYKESKTKKAIKSEEPSVDNNYKENENSLVNIKLIARKKNNPGIKSIMRSASEEPEHSSIEKPWNLNANNKSFYDYNSGKTEEMNEKSERETQSKLLSDTKLMENLGTKKMPNFLQTKIPGNSKFKPELAKYYKINNSKDIFTAITAAERRKQIEMEMILASQSNLTNNNLNKIDNVLLPEKIFNEKPKEGSQSSSIKTSKFGELNPRSSFKNNYNSNKINTNSNDNKPNHTNSKGNYQTNKSYEPKTNPEITCQNQKQYQKGQIKNNLKTTCNNDNANFHPIPSSSSSNDNNNFIPDLLFYKNIIEKSNVQRFSNERYSCLFLFEKLFIQLYIMQYVLFNDDQRNIINLLSGNLKIEDLNLIDNILLSIQNLLLNSNRQTSLKNNTNKISAYSEPIKNDFKKHIDDELLYMAKSLFDNFLSKYYCNGQ